jgi:surface antigen
VRRIALALCLVVLTAPPATARDWRKAALRWAAVHPVDLYPWRHAQAANTSDWQQHRDPWGWPLRWCSSYVAWAEAQRGHPMLATAWQGDTNDWLAHPAPGWMVTDRPRRGEVAVWRPGYFSYRMNADGSYDVAGVAPGGHVGVVTWVFRDGTIEVADYNGYTHGWDPGRFLDTGTYLQPH